MNRLNKSKNLKNFIISISLICLIGLGCQPEKGNLTPLPSAGIEITTTDLDNDTALIKFENLIFKINGKWSEGILFEIAVNNPESKEILLNFGEMTLIDGENEIAKVGDITETQANNFIYIRHARIDGKENMEKAPEIKIKPKENRRFSVVFLKTFDSLSDTEEKRTLQFSLPIEINGTLNTKRNLEVIFKATK